MFKSFAVVGLVGVGQAFSVPYVAVAATLVGLMASVWKLHSWMK